MSDMVYAGTYDCTAILDQIKVVPGDVRSAAKPYSDSVNLSSYFQNEANQMLSSWLNAGYGDSVEWINFYPVKHFEESLLSGIYTQLKVNPKRVWISSINPGKCVPWHWDIETSEHEWSKEGKLVRYTVYMDEPKIGHVFVVGDQCMYNVPAGSIYKWNNWKEYHLGFNCGFEKKYVLHIVGIE
jgi:hypothetical protein